MRFISKLSMVAVALSAVVGCSSGGDETDGGTDSGVELGSESSESNNNVQPTDTQQAVTGDWRIICSNDPDPESTFVSGTSGIIFYPDGIFRGYSVLYEQSDCQGEETFVPPGLDPLEDEARYQVVGTATSNEGLSVYEVTINGGGFDDSTTYYHIDGDVLYGTLDITNGIEMLLQVPYTRQ